jgi:hypothetical protein
MARGTHTAMEFAWPSVAEGQERDRHTRGHGVPRSVAEWMQVLPAEYPCIAAHTISHWSLQHLRCIAPNVKPVLALITGRAFAGWEQPSKQ